jgi:hypothetical protein
MSTKTARRRWSKELSNEIDGIALGASGPVLLHGYEEPVGGKWMDSVIPGKLAARDRTTGEQLWSSPCEVGYGRGFGAGLGPEEDVVVLGPSLQGHRIVRMRLDNGELINLKSIRPFDLALVAPDVCLCLTPNRVSAILTAEMIEAWEFSKSGMRFHNIGRQGKSVYVVASKPTTGEYSVLVLDAQTGRPRGTLVEGSKSVIHAIAAEPGAVVMLVEKLEDVLSRDAWMDHILRRIQEDPDAEVEEPKGLALAAFDPAAGQGKGPLWTAAVEGEHQEDLPEATLGSDSGKVYLANGAALHVRDSLTGRALGSQTVPGLDEHIAWGVADGAGVLAEETRISVFEIPD